MTEPVIAAYKGPAGPDVLAFAESWSAASGRPLTVITVHPGRAPVGRGRVDFEWVAYNREEAERILDGARGTLTGDRVEFRAVAADSASHGLHDVMEAESGAVIVLGSRDTRGVRRTAPGSTAERLLTGAPGTVVLVPWDYEEVAHPVERITVAFVDAPDGRAALAAGRRMAEEVGARLAAVSVLPDTRTTPGLGDPSRFERAQSETFRRGLQEAVDELAPGAEIRLLTGPVVEALADIGPEQTDLLVCGSRGYGPALRVLLGGVSSRLLRHARVPVALVPRGRS